MKRKKYEKPERILVGNVSSLTEANIDGDTLDFGFEAGTLLDEVTLEYGSV